ncbi:MAG: hypothetical protein QS721_02530 [Candidatus Endonucleobacter sp. (ex Gigantidas childressi)]|nr:hypothetical protein [Candidatus Endonucleobacter sp. (ex Gigantidas childressi)]
MLKVSFLYFFLSVLFPVCALGVGIGVDDDEQIKSIIAYGFTPADVLISSENPERQQKMEDFIIGMSLKTKRARVLIRLKRELDERPLSDILKYVEHHNLNAAAEMLNKYSSEGVMSGVLNKRYEEGGMDGVLQYIIGLFDLVGYEKNENSSETMGVSEDLIVDMDDSEVDVLMVEETLRAILFRLDGICKAHNIKPKLASQKGVVNKSIDFLTNGFSKMMIKTGLALCTIGASEYVVSSLGAAAEYMLPYTEHDPTSTTHTDDCLYFECNGGERVDITNAGSFPGCIVVEVPPSYESADLCMIPFDEDGEVMNAPSVIAPVQVGEDGNHYKTVLDVDDMANRRYLSTSAYYVMAGSLIVACGSATIVVGYCALHFKKNRAINWRLGKLDDSDYDIVSLVNTEITLGGAVVRESRNRGCGGDSPANADIGME